MATETYDIGDRPVLIATFKDEDDVLTTMTAIVFKIIDPAGTVTTKAITDATSPSTGVYEWQIPAAFTTHGRWVLRAAGTSPIETAAELVVRVRDSAFS
jgi:hypothetical protein